MVIIGADFHPQFEQIAWLDTDTGEFKEQRLQHREEAEWLTTFWALLRMGQPILNPKK